MKVYSPRNRIERQGWEGEIIDSGKFHESESMDGDKEVSQVLPVVDKRHFPWLNGVELLEDAYWNKRFLPTGFEGIDMLLGGGLREGQLTEIVGPSSSGKTQFCLYVASHIADKQLGNVMFLDTSNSFSSHRLECIINELSNTLVREAEERRLKRIMSSILCQSVFDIFELLDVLNQLDHTLKNQVKNRDAKICLLIIDSLSSLITPILGGKGPQGRKLMVSAGFILKKLADEHNISIIVTNHMVGGDGGVSKPALGESWKNIPHIRLLVSRDHGSDICNISILKHTFMIEMAEMVETMLTSPARCLAASKQPGGPKVEPMLISSTALVLKNKVEQMYMLLYHFNFTCFGLVHIIPHYQHFSRFPCNCSTIAPPLLSHLLCIWVLSTVI